MKLSSLAFLMIVGGCATAQPLVSPGQRKSFEDVVRQAEAAGAATEPPAAALHLRDAKSEFEYAQRIPRDPAHARRLMEQAQGDAELALTLARRHLQENADGRETARRDEKATEATTNAPIGASGP
jgi:hypothetical protein